MHSSSYSDGAEAHVVQYQRATWTASINLFSSSISWEGSLSENKPLCLKHGLHLNLFNFCLSLYISLSSLRCYSPTFPLTPLFFPVIPSSLSLLFALLCHHPPPPCVFSLLSPFLSPLWFVSGVSLSIWLSEPRASVSCYSSPGWLIKPCIVKDNPSETIRIFIPCPLFFLWPHT